MITMTNSMVKDQDLGLTPLAQEQVRQLLDVVAITLSAQFEDLKSHNKALFASLEGKIEETNFEVKAPLKAPIKAMEAISAKCTRPETVTQVAEELEDKAVEIFDDLPTSKTNGVPQKKELEDMTK
ncbi:hypothetical protein ACLB2K_000955 [Fragaria x ananassa]